MIYTVNIDVSIFELGILRAVVEKREEIGHHFGSAITIPQWIAKAVEHQLIELDEGIEPDASFFEKTYHATSFGEEVYAKLRLADYSPNGRAYMWPKADELVDKLWELLNEKEKA